MKLNEVKEATLVEFGGPEQLKAPGDNQPKSDYQQTLDQLTATIRQLAVDMTKNAKESNVVGFGGPSREDPSVNAKRIMIELSRRFGLRAY